MIRTIEYGHGQVLSFAEYGDRTGDPVLVQHGLIASIRDGRLFARLTEAGRRVICIARPGYGASSPCRLANVGRWGEIVAVLADALGIRQCDVLGLSSGAPYTYAIGCRLPDRVRRIFILSGVPALCDAAVRAHWPHPVTPDATLAELQKLAGELFFAHLSAEGLWRNDIRDSMAHDNFGIALDLSIRGADWGFTLADVRAPVIMEHSKADTEIPFVTAALTAGLLPSCRFLGREGSDHFSQEVLDHFVSSVMLRP